MTIIFIDGSTMECRELEFGMYGDIIVDGYRMVDAKDIIRIIAKGDSAK